MGMGASEGKKWSDPFWGSKGSLAHWPIWKSEFVWFSHCKVKALWGLGPGGDNKKKKTVQVKDGQCQTW